MAIRQLSQVEINRIAAGEVIERPASAIKELVENAIDAGASSIEAIAQDGGLSFLRVSDNGCGMDEADLALSVERHATS
ncbi:MAG: ATP-binding protein, partial [Rhodomicrobium sp.]